MLRIGLCSLMVNDQENALEFYTEILGFRKYRDIPMGAFRWLTVVSPASEGVELVLEPLGFEPARTYQKSLFDAGIPVTAFATDDIQQEYERLEARGVRFRTPPTVMGPVTLAVFEDGCGNLLQIYEVNTSGGL